MIKLGLGSLQNFHGSTLCSPRCERKSFSRLYSGWKIVRWHAWPFPNFCLERESKIPIQRHTSLLNSLSWVLLHQICKLLLEEFLLSCCIIIPTLVFTLIKGKKYQYRITIVSMVLLTYQNK